jgi:hypothetical protein
MSFNMGHRRMVIIWHEIGFGPMIFLFESDSVLDDIAYAVGLFRHVHADSQWFHWL